MSAAPLRRFDSPRSVRVRSPARDSRSASTQDARAAERRRRQRHFRRRRRDLLEDVALALLLTIVLISVTAGLGVLLLLEAPLAAAVIGSFVLERRLRRARAATPRQRPRR